MKELLQLKQELEAEKEKALKAWVEFRKNRTKTDAAHAKGSLDAFSFIVKKLNLLEQQPTNDVQPQLQQRDVSGRSEQLPLTDAQIRDKGASYCLAKGIKDDYHVMVLTNGYVVGYSDGYSDAVDGNCH